MDPFFRDNLFSLGLGLLLSSLALFFAFKAGQAIGKSSVESLHEFTLGALKQETALKLEVLKNKYKETTGNIAIPDDIDINYNRIVDKFMEIDQTLVEKCLALHKILLDLERNGTTSFYFVEFMNWLL